ncbi:hypothetical protein [Nonomuraea sp. NPDC003214]
MSRIGDVPIKVIYLVAAVVATVAAVLLVFVVFSGDVPEEPAVEEVVPVVPVPSASGSVSGSPTATGTTAGAAVPARRAFPKLGGKASGTIIDRSGGIGYPRLGGPWGARDFPPFAVAQRVGKATVPQTLVASIPEPERRTGRI